MAEGNDQSNEDRLGSTEVMMNRIINAMDSADEVVRLHKLLELAYEVYSRPIALCKDADDRVYLLLSLYLEHSQPFLASLRKSLENLQIQVRHLGA